MVDGRMDQRRGRFCCKRWRVDHSDQSGYLRDACEVVKVQLQGRPRGFAAEFVVSSMEAEETGGFPEILCQGREGIESKEGIQRQFEKRSWG